MRAWSFGDRTPTATSDWQDAAAEVEAPGLADLGDRVVLYGGALGFIDLFTRELDNAIWFASRIGPLLSLDTAPLEVDWEAWASILVFTCPVDEATPFRAIGRLQGARTHTLDRATRRIRRERWSPPWQALPEVHPDAGDPNEVLERLRGVVRTIGGEPYAMALSGGSDSRLVALAALDVGIEMAVWSTTKDDARDDVEITRELASLLGLPLTFVDPAAMPYATVGEDVRHRTEGMVGMHTWIGALASALRANGQPVLTDVVGGVVLRGANQSREIARMSPGPERRLALMSRLERRPIIGKTLSERAAPWVLDTARQRWLESIRHLEGDSNELELAMIETRDARGIAPISQCLFGPAVRVETPLSRPDMLLAAFSVGTRRKSHSGFSRELLAAADPIAGTLRTTNDRRIARNRSPSLKAGAESRAWLRADIEQARAVPGLVPDGLLRYLELGRWAGPSRRELLLRRTPPPRSHALDAPKMAEIARLSLPVAHLGAWIATNRHRLASIEPPWNTR